MEALVGLPGVGRKTANVVLGHAMGIPALPVDRHVLRVAKRIGMASAKTPEGVEQQLCRTLPPPVVDAQPPTRLILHGRRDLPAPAALRPVCRVGSLRVCRLRCGAVGGAPARRKPQERLRSGGPHHAGRQAPSRPKS